MYRFVTVCSFGTLLVSVLLIGTLWICGKRYTLVIVIIWVGTTRWLFKGVFVFVHVMGWGF